MTRRQKTIARDFPFVVKTTVPPGGLGERLNAIYAFHRDRGIRLAVLPHQHDVRGNYLLWYFDSPPIAEKFAEEFSSQRVAPRHLWRSESLKHLRQIRAPRTV